MCIGCFDNVKSSKNRKSPSSNSRLVYVDHERTHHHSPSKFLKRWCFPSWKIIFLRFLENSIFWVLFLPSGGWGWPSTENELFFREIWGLRVLKPHCNFWSKSRVDGREWPSTLNKLGEGYPRIVVGWGLMPEGDPQPSKKPENLGWWSPATLVERSTSRLNAHKSV